MKYFLSKSFFSFVYVISCSITTYGISLLENLVVKIVASSIMLVFCFYLATVVAMKTGEDALKVRHANDLERKEIIRTGRDIPLKLKEEYKLYKGFLIGFIVCAPIVLCLIIHTFTSVIGGDTNMLFGKLANTLGMVLYWIFFISYTETIYLVYFNLIFVALFTLWFGFFYYVGAKRQMLRYEFIEQKRRMIHGDEEL